jgi:hypothetical protein
MSVDSLDPQLQTLYNLLKSDIDAMNNNINVINTSIVHLHEKMDSHIIYSQGFIDDTRNRLNQLERKTA